MAVNSFQIIVDKSFAVYAPGEIIAGKVFLSLDGRKSCRGIKLKFKGSGRVYWQYDSDDYSAKEEHYLQKEVYISGNPHGEEELIEGEYIFPFAFLLPTNIPNSFHHDYGKIEYSIKAVLDSASAMDHYAHLRFQIYSPLDLSQVPSLPIIDVMRQVYNYCLAPCISNGSMEAQIRIPSRTFNIGDQLEVFIDVETRSRSVEITEIVVQLKQTLEFHAEVRTKTCSRIIQLAAERGPFRGSTSVKLGFQIPRVHHSGLQHCSIIRIMYCLVVRVVTPDCYRNTENKYDIKIGSKSMAMAQYPANYWTSSAPPTARVDWPSAELQISSASSVPPLPVVEMMKDAVAMKTRPHPSPNDPQSKT